MAAACHGYNRDGEARLIGCKCRSCGSVFFPNGATCVVCGGIAPDRLELPSIGQVEALTRIGDRWVAELRLEGGPLVMGWLDGVEPVSVGSRVRFQPIDATLRFTLDAG